MAAAISSVVSSALTASTRPEALEPPGRDTKNDHDKDDIGGAAAAATSAAPKPTVNTQGQLTGTVLNTTA
jgi:hypothetical protein